MKPGLNHLFGLVLLCIAAPAQAAPLLTDVHYKWEGPALVFYATFNQAEHDLPFFLEWRAAGDAGEHRTQIDYIEQYARGMPIAVTVASLGQDASGRRVLYMGQPRANTPKIEDPGAVAGRIVLEDPANPREEYPFAIASDAPSPK
jgi:hypothetical protein